MLPVLSLAFWYEGFRVLGFRVQDLGLRVLLGMLLGVPGGCSKEWKKMETTLLFQVQGLASRVHSKYPYNSKTTISLLMRHIETSIITITDLLITKPP